MTPAIVLWSVTRWANDRSSVGDLLADGMAERVAGRRPVVLGEKKILVCQLIEHGLNICQRGFPWINRLGGLCGEVPTDRAGCFQQELCFHSERVDTGDNRAFETYRQRSVRRIIEIGQHFANASDHRDRPGVAKRQREFLAVKRIAAAVLVDEVDQGLGKLGRAQFPANEFFDPSLGHRGKIDLDEIIGLLLGLGMCCRRSPRPAACDQQEPGQPAGDGGEKLN